jgi:ribosomal protein S18 acetylase RimI-like enzyme
MKIGRMNKKDVDRIVCDIIKEFGYVFEYIFNTKDKTILKHSLHSLLTSGFGFGFMGYMNFYAIKNKENEEVGWMKIDTSHICRIYRICEDFSLPFRLASIFGVFKLHGIAKRSKEVTTLQEPLNDQAFHLTYFVIHEQYRNQKYGTAAINLLINAFFNSKTNNINVSKLIALVREHNQASLSLFRHNGFSEFISEDIKFDPLEQLQGKGIFLKYFNNE